MSSMTTIQTIEPRTAPDAATPEVRTEGAWRVYPLEGALELHYRDVTGHQSRRRQAARPAAKVDPRPRKRLRAVENRPLPESQARAGSAMTPGMDLITST